jgi:peptidoglycan/xylan/chitin deacetylase (PgdA/CDA1 family)
MSLLKQFKLLPIILAFACINLAYPLVAKAAAGGPAPSGKVSFTFDDGYTSALSQAAPTLAKYGMSGTSFVITGCVGMATVPNTCHANTDKTYMSWAQLTQLKSAYGWEIASHTVDHSCLASIGDGTDCQTTKLTAAQVSNELSQSKATLAAHGFNATDIATPYGDYDQSTLAQIAKYYEAHRGFADTGLNASPYNQYIIRDEIATGGVAVDTLKSYVDQAIVNKQWLVLSFHDILTNASNNKDDYEYSTAKLDALAAYVKSKNVTVVNMTDGLVRGTNMLSNPTFDSGIAGGWTTDGTANFVKNTANNGSYPSPTNSVAFAASTTNKHLFSPTVNVNPSTSYMLMNFINLTKITGGSVGYYIDEYNANGSWISGQYKLGVSFPWPQTTGFEYKPTSPSVTSARLQVILPANSGAQGYLDNFQWIDEGLATPPPTQTNLMPNGTFDAGITGGWRTDAPSTILADTANNGSPANPVNSVKMTAVSSNTHLFSPLIPVNSTKSYSVSSYVNIKQMTSGEVGFYIDEYDTAGNWISGKYITGDRVTGANTISFNYTPSSTNVKSASLQFICVGGSGIIAYVDNVVWF